MGSFLSPVHGIGAGSPAADKGIELRSELQLGRSRESFLPVKML